MRRYKFEDYYNVKSFIFKGKKYKRGICKNIALGDFKSRHFFAKNADMENMNNHNDVSDDFSKNQTYKGILLNHEVTRLFGSKGVVSEVKYFDKKGKKDVPC